MREETLDAWTQGLTEDMKCNGEFNPVDMRDMRLSQALHIIRNMPNLPPEQKRNRDYCPPQILFEEKLAISHIEKGKYYVFPMNRFCTLEEAEEIIINHYKQHSEK